MDNQTINEGLENFNYLVHKIDLLTRPYIVFVNPSDAKGLRKAIKNLDEKVVIQETEYVKRGTTAIVNREELEKWSKLGLTKGDSIETVEEVLTDNNGDDWEHRGSGYSHSN